jgi:hypothetical protein
LEYEWRQHPRSLLSWVAGVNVIVSGALEEDPMQRRYRKPGLYGQPAIRDAWTDSPTRKRAQHPRIWPTPRRARHPGPMTEIFGPPLAGAGPKRPHIAHQRMKCHPKRERRSSGIAELPALRGPPMPGLGLLEADATHAWTREFGFAQTSGPKRGS